MSTLTVQIHNPKARKLLRDMEELDLISVEREEEPKEVDDDSPCTPEEIAELKRNWKVKNGPSLEFLLNFPVATEEELQVYADFGRDYRTWETK